MPNRKEYRLVLNDDKQWTKALALWRMEGKTAADKLRSFIEREAKRFDSKYGKGGINYATDRND